MDFIVYRCLIIAVGHGTSGGATVVYMQDDAWSGVSEDHIKLWIINMDWENTGNSTVSAPQVLGAAEE